MPITIHSPYSGRPVKVRDGDIERALRDEENRVFYVVKRPTGEGYYAALTRKGSDKDMRRYDELLEKMDTAREVGAERSHAQVHDATGRGRPGTRRRAIFLLLILIVLGIVTWFVLTRFYPGVITPSQPTPAPAVQPAASKAEGLAKSQRPQSNTEKSGVYCLFSVSNGASLEPSLARYEVPFALVAALRDPGLVTPWATLAA